MAVTAREALDNDLCKGSPPTGSPAIVWRLEGEAPAESVERAAALGVGLFVLAPDVPLRQLLEIFSKDDGLLLLSHGAGRTLLESAGGEATLEELAGKV